MNLPADPPPPAERLIEGWARELDLPGIEGFAQALVATGLLLDCAEQLRVALTEPSETGVAVLEAVFEALLPFALAWQEHCPHPRGQFEGPLRPRFLLLKLILDLACHQEGLEARRSGLLASYLGRHPNAQSALLLRALDLAECGRSDEAIALIDAVANSGPMRLLPQQILTKLSRGRLTSLLARGEPSRTHADLADRFCPVPFDEFQMDSNGHGWTCCPSWLPVPLGNFHQSDWHELWNSLSALEIRRSILDGDFQYCSRLQCPKIQDGILPLRAEVTDPAHRRILDQHLLTTPGPRRFVFAQDPSCNLACPQCRTEPYRPAPDFLQSLDALMASTIRPILAHAAAEACSMLISGNGDPFASRHYLEILSSLDSEAHRNIELQLLTNGLGLRKAWPRLPNLHTLLRSGYVGVSVDAASPAAYRAVRGGSWELLLENLQFLSGLRKQGTVGRVILYFAVQTCNFLDMGTLVGLTRTLGFDRVEFYPLRNEGTYPPVEYLERAVFLPSHPRFANFLETIRTPIFTDPVVYLGGFNDLLARPESAPTHPPVQEPS